MTVTTKRPEGVNTQPVLARRTSHRPVLPTVHVRVMDDLDERTLLRLADQLDEAVSLHPDEVVVDLSGCNYLDAQALRVLMDAHIRLYTDGGRLCLRGVNPATHRLLALAGLKDVFTIRPLTEPAGRRAASAR